MIRQMQSSIINCVEQTAFLISDCHLVPTTDCGQQSEVCRLPLLPFLADRQADIWDTYSCVTSIACLSVSLSNCLPACLWKIGGQLYIQSTGCLLFLSHNSYFVIFNHCTNNGVWMLNKWWCVNLVWMLFECVLLKAHKHLVGESLYYT